MEHSLPHDCNKALDILLYQARSSSAGARDTINRWLNLAESAGLTGEVLDRRARFRLARAFWCLRYPGTIAFGNPDSHFIARNHPAVRSSERSIPLEQRGHEAGSRVWTSAHAYFLAQNGLSAEEYTALCHFKALTGYDRGQATDLFLHLARHYHFNVRRLWKSKKFICVAYGQPRIHYPRNAGPVRLAGVVLKAIRRDAKTGRRTLLIEFRHALGKRTFDVELPHPLPALESLDMSPKAPEAPPLSKTSDDALQEVSTVLHASPGRVKLNLLARASALLSLHFGETCAHAWRYGRLAFSSWDRDRGRFHRENGVWIDAFDASTLNVTLALERRQGCIKRLVVPALACVTELDQGLSMRAEDSRLFVLCRSDGAPAGYAARPRALDERWGVGSTALAALRATN